MRQRADVSTTDAVSDIYDVLGQALRISWDDNFHLGLWDSDDDDSSVETATDRFTDLLISRLNVASGQRVLDIGCGIGKPAIRLNKTTGAKVVGITINEAHVNEASTRASQEGVSANVTFDLRDGTDTGFSEASFDAVMAFESILYMDRHLALREMTRVVRPGGRLVLTDIVRADDAILSSNIPGPQMPRARDYYELADQAGVTIEGIEDLSWRTRRSFPLMQQRLHESADELNRTIGSAGSALVAEVLTSLAEDSPMMGCILVTARRPA